MEHARRIGGIRLSAVVDIEIIRFRMKIRSIKIYFGESKMLIAGAVGVGIILANTGLALGLVAILL